MRAYHSDPTLKASVLAQLRAHREADGIIKGTYWDDGYGCAVGCPVGRWDGAGLRDESISTGFDDADVRRSLERLRAEDSR